MSNVALILEDKIKKAARQYYLGSPVITDTQFDYLVEKLRDTDPENPLLSTTGWGFNPSEVSDPSLKEVTHLYDIIKFEGKVRDPDLIKIPLEDRIVTPKYDGGSIMCYYNEGKLNVAVTRGDGITGFDVTDNVKSLVPEYLTDDFTGMVRGEIIMKTSTFETKYKGNGYTSARNLATGWSRKSGLTQENLSDLDFVAYTVRGKSSTADLSNKVSVLSWIHQNGFTEPDVLKVTDWSMDSLIKIVTDYRSIYGIDGLVITSINYDQQDDGTWVPHKEVAYKIKAETKETTVKRIEWNLTRTMKMVPKAVIDPVVLAEATISNAAAFNAKYVSESGLGAGAKIIIQRSGEVIPDIVDVIERVNVRLPTKCPVCNEDLVMKGTDLWCVNKDCPARNSQMVRHFISIIAPVKGLGSSVLEKFLDSYEVTSLDTLYKAAQDTEVSLTNRLKDLQGIGDRSIGLLETMKGLLLKPHALNQVLPALNIKGLSGTTANKISKIENILERLHSEDETLIDDINRVVNSMVRESLSNGGMDLIKYAVLDIDGLTVTNPVVKSNTDDMIKVTITGKLSVPRKEFDKYLNDHQFVESPINKSSLLITDNPNGSSSKNKIANEKGIAKVSESSLRDYIDNQEPLIDYEGNEVKFD